MPSSVKKFAFIDALRGYAIVLVVLVHSAQAIRPESYTLQALMEFGARGVQLFFIASSITLCLSWHARNTTEKSPTRNFFIRRLFRIAPMYWIAVAFYLALYGFEPRYWAPNGISWYSIPLTALFVNGYSPENINSLVPGGWSIAVEVNFYLLFPLIILFAFNLQRSLILILITLGVSQFASRFFNILYSGMFSLEHDYIVRNFIFLNFFNQAPVFAIGISAYFMIFTEKISRLAAMTSVAVLLGAVTLVAIYRGSAIRYLNDHLILTAILFAMIAVSLHRAVLSPGFLTRLLVNRLVQYVGKISFSLYLVHFAVLFYLEKFGVKENFHPGNFSSIGYFLLVLFFGFLIATFFYFYVERPSVRFGSRVIRSLEGRNMRTGTQTNFARGEASQKNQIND